MVADQPQHDLLHAAKRPAHPPAARTRSTSSIPGAPTTSARLASHETSAAAGIPSSARAPRA